MRAAEQSPSLYVACRREDELLDALQAPAWPHSASADLQAHLDACTSCRELAAIALALVDEHRAAVIEAPVPSSGAVWFRAQLRARREAAAAAARPISVVQFIGVACALGLVAGGLTILASELREFAFTPGPGGWLAWAANLPSMAHLDLAQLQALGPTALVVLLGLTALLLVAPLALYLARE